MANNGGRQGGGGGGAAGNGNMNEHIEFTVKAEEDLYLEGVENTIRRVTAETNYSCLMLKTQRFSSLFRHYAKYHGLRKDDLEYYFVNPLENEDTPESVQLQRGDTIMVRKRRKPEQPELATDHTEFFKDFRELLEEDEHMDLVFKVRGDSSTSSSSVIGGSTSGPPLALHSKRKVKTEQRQVDLPMTYACGERNGVDVGMGVDGGASEDDDDVVVDAFGQPQQQQLQSHDEVEIRAHKCILTARSDYFKNMFSKTTAFRESKMEHPVVLVDPCFRASTVRRMLEFLYCNRVEDISKVNAEDILNLLQIADQWMLRDLKRLCEYELIRKHMDVETVAKMYCAASEYNAKRLSDACIDFIMDNIKEVTGNASFQEEMRNYPSLCFPVLQAAAELVPEPVHKKQRVSEGGMIGPPGMGAAGSGISSSPVPDSDC